MRAREYGIAIGDGTPGPLNAITAAYLTELYDATVEATEEAIVNAMLGARTLEGPDRVVAHGLDGERLRAAMAAR